MMMSRDQLIEVMTDLAVIEHENGYPLTEEDLIEEAWRKRNVRGADISRLMELYLNPNVCRLVKSRARERVKATATTRQNLIQRL